MDLLKMAEANTPKKPEKYSIFHTDYISILNKLKYKIVRILAQKSKKVPNLEPCTNVS